MTQIGKYQIVEQVGEGAMGVVYKATDSVLNRTVAVKVMSEGLAQDADLRERFLREAQSAGSLQHPNLVTIYDFGETDGHLFIAMEFIEGVDLEKLMEMAEPLSLTVKLDLMIDVLNGLSYAHRRGIIHRDIKPANIRVDQEGRGRIMDFGVARMETSNLTGTGTMMGTPNYMAPEQITGGVLTAGADIWSVGAVLYEILANKKPFAADTLHRVLFKIVSDAPAELLESSPGLPVALDAIVKKALAKDPEQRYKAAVEMANALASVRAKLGAPRASHTVSHRVSIDDALRQQQQRRPTTAIPTVGRKWVAIGSGLAALFLVVALASYFGNRAGRAASPSATVARTDTAAPAVATPPATSAPAQPPPPVAAQPNRDSSRVAAAPPAAVLRQTKAPAPTKVAARDTQARVASNPQPQSPVAPAAQGTPAQQTTSVVTPPIVAPLPVVPSATTAVTPPPPPVVENPRPVIASIVEAYADAIGTRQVTEVRKVYVGMTPQQQSNWESFFSSMRSIKATLGITSLDVSGNTAVARLTGTYEFVTRAGRADRQPASFEATFQRDGERWMLQRVR